MLYSAVAYAHLLSNNLCDLGITVTKGVHGNSSCEIKVPPVLHIPQVASLTFNHHRRRANVGGDHEGRSLFYEGHCCGIGSWVGIG